MNRDYESLLKQTRELAEISSILHTLAWDQETYMPTRGSVPRARQVATLSGLYHQKLTSPQFGSILERLRGSELDLWSEATVKEARRQHDKSVKVPEGLVRELAETCSLGYQAWVQARQESDLSIFLPWLEKTVELKKQEAKCLQFSDSLYEALLDEYEPGMTESRLDETFALLRPELTSLLQKTEPLQRQHPPDLLRGSFARQKQRDFGCQILTSMGFDWEAGRLDESPHPFCTGLSPLDVRITTRYSEEDFSPSLFGIVHEGGHALYEQGLDAKRYGSPACDAVSLGIHESQSRLWENQVARGRPFWRHWLPLLKNTFPGELDHLPLDDFLRAINRVQASFIRVDADEVSYGLHVILRYELERSLIGGDLQARHLEDMWNTKMEEYLGITPRTSAEGVLQDTHWSQGLIGYFPTYLLGNLYAAQFFETAKTSLPGLEDGIAKGELLPLRGWLRERIHQRAKTVTAEELVQDVSGQPLSPQFFIDYLHNKFGAIYEL